jgi:hypothetical protein
MGICGVRAWEIAAPLDISEHLEMSVVAGGGPFPLDIAHLGR